MRWAARVGLDFLQFFFFLFAQACISQSVSRWSGYLLKVKAHLSWEPKHVHLFFARWLEVTKISFGAPPLREFFAQHSVCGK